MVKTLENNILKSKIKRAKVGILALVSFFYFGLAGCEPIVPTTNYAPKESISSSQPSTKVGTPIYLNADGTDENGIANHLIVLDNNNNWIIDAGDLELTKQDSPIKNYSWTPTKAGTYSFIAQGTDNLDSSLKGTARLEIVVSDNVINPPVNYAPVASISANPASIKIGESVSLALNGTDENGNEDIVEYKIGLDKNNDNNISSDEELIKQAFPITNYSWTSNQTGTFKLIGQCTDKTGLNDNKEANITISPSNLPNVTLTTTDLIDGRTSIITLPSPTDDDTSGIIPYISAEILGGNVTPTLNGNQLTLQPNSVSQNTPYQVRLTFGSEAGGINTANLEGVVVNLCDVSGFLQNNETDSNQAGTIKLYDGTTSLSSIPTTDGNFNFQVNSPALEIKLQAQDNNGGYIRTITLDGTKDYSNLIVRAVPKPNFGDPATIKADFREFMRKINETYDGIKKWNLSQFQGIEILYQNHYDSDLTNHFTSEKQNIIANLIKDSNEVEKLVNGKSLDEYIQIDGVGNIPPAGKETHFKNSDNWQNWILVMPNTKATTYAGVTGFNITAGGIINGGLIQLVPSYVSIGNPVTVHEFAHIFIDVGGHASGNIISYTITASDGLTCTSPGPADEKAAKLIYENTYLPKENLDDILGMNWIN